MINVNADNFWQFSLNYYPKVKQICLAWQDSFNANINLLLLLCYLEQQQLSINDKTLISLHKQLMAYNTRITQRLRLLRRRVHSLNNVSFLPQQQLKQQLLAVELVAEQQEQQLLIHAITIINTPKTLIESYLQLLQQPISTSIQQQLAQLRLVLSLYAMKV